MAAKVSAARRGAGRRCGGSAGADAPFRSDGGPKEACGASCGPSVPRGSAEHCFPLALCGLRCSAPVTALRSGGSPRCLHALEAPGRAKPGLARGAVRARGRRAERPAAVPRRAVRC